MRAVLSLVLAAILAAVGGGAAMAADTSPGAALFWRYCATCHGEGARGDGPTAEILAAPPPDLTVLAAENGGVFPVARLVRRIDGRETVVAHGSPMPIYGAFFDGAPMIEVDTPEGPLSASAPVAEIAEYLRGLQR